MDPLPRRFDSALLVLLTGAILVGAPLAGVALSGMPVAPYLGFPPRPGIPATTSFSWGAFTAMSAAVAAVIAPFAWRLLQVPPARHRRRVRPFPAWGYGAAALLAVSWALAWTRFEWFRAFQPHTFTPLWLGYIGVINAVIVRQRGWSPMTRRPAAFAGLFALSALFWWFFEYLNRYTGNWRYAGIESFGATEYAVFATMSFSTVLPAVASTAELIGGSRRIDAAFAHWHEIRARHPRVLAAAGFLVAALSLAALPAFPDRLYPIIWISPALLLVSGQGLFGLRSVLAPLAHGDWRRLVAYCAAAVVCGFWWEMWNYGSLAHWQYSVPHAGRFHLFEMPLLGYAGYLPFGIECAAVAALILDRGEHGRGNAATRRGAG